MNDDMQKGKISAQVNGQKINFHVDNAGEVSDGYHTFNELYDHRVSLFLALCRHVNPNDTRVWRSKAHHPEDDLDMYEGWFIMGVITNKGEQLSYHLPLSRWEETDFAETLDHAPKWDGHTPDDVLARLKTL